jgi:UDPglucose--hexose-1-phosphate uridylyltransferase
MPEPLVAEFPHRRYNPLRRQWVLVSPHRTNRPWQGEVNKTTGFSELHYDPTCYLCPGNERAGGVRNPDYKGVFSFNNDYASLLPDSPAPPANDAWPLLLAQRERGLCRVVCFHPDHSLTLARMELPDIRAVVDNWTQQYAEIGAKPDIRYVQIFENRGAMMGASNPHPHCQIWATEHVPDEPATESESLSEYHRLHGSCLLCDYVTTEVANAKRIVCENEDFLAVVPWWAVWPFETLLLAKAHVGSLARFSDHQRDSLAAILKQITTCYDNLFETSFPYTMGLHQSPTDGEQHPHWHFHAHFYPPLLRSATVRKFMVGFEMLGMPQRDITAETAAERLRVLPDIHFTLKPEVNP